MSGDISKEEKERQLDEKIKALRAKNAQVVQRKMEVDKDRQLAEKTKSSITVQTKFPEGDAFVPPEAKFRGNKPRREELTVESKREQPPPAAPRRPNGRLGETDGPPPDPGYRFLADRMREGSSEEEEAADGGGGGQRRNERRPPVDSGGSWARGRGGGGVGAGVRGMPSSRGVGSGRGGRGDKEPTGRFPHVSSHQDDSRLERRSREDFSDVQPFVGEKSVGRIVAGGPIEGFAQPRHHHNVAPLLSPKDEGGHHRRYIAPFRPQEPRSSNSQVTGSQQQHHHESYSAKVKSLLAEDLPARYRVDSAGSWMEDDEEDEEEEDLRGRQALLASPRKIEAQGGKITITRTLDSPVRNADAGSAGRQYHQDETALGELANTVPVGRQPIYSSPKAVNSSLDESNQRRMLVNEAVSEYPMTHSSYATEPSHKEFIPYGNRPGKPVSSSYSNGLSGHQQVMAPPQPLLTMEEQVKVWEEDTMAYDQQADWVLVPQYGMLAMNHQMMPVPSFPPPFYPASNRHPGLAPGGGMPQFYAQQQQHVVPVTANYHMTGSYHPHHQTDYIPYQDTIAAVVTSSPATTSTPTAFNPAAQVFVPPAEQIQPSGLYHSPPPQLLAAAPPSSAYHYQRTPNTLQNISSNNNNINKPDPNLLVSLKSPPAPLPFNHSQEGRKYFPDSGSKFASSSPKSSSTGLSRPSSEKYTQNNNSRLPPRFQKNRENISGDVSSSGGGGGGFVGSRQAMKPPSLIEMQIESQKKIPFPRPPPGHGTGLLVFGTSNIVNYLQTERLSAELSMPVRLIPAMKMDVFEEKVEEVSPAKDWLVLVHGLGKWVQSVLWGVGGRSFNKLLWFESQQLAGYQDRWLPVHRFCGKGWISGCPNIQNQRSCVVQYTVLRCRSVFDRLWVFFSTVPAPIKSTGRLSTIIFLTTSHLLY